MKRFLACAFLLVFCAAMSAAEPAPAVKKGLVVHEWGVFRAASEGGVANANVRQEWDGLPAFVHGNIQGRGVPQHWGQIEVRFRPLVFFHATEATRVKAKVDFPGGMPGVWWPATHRPSVLGNERLPGVDSFLEWDVAVKALPPGWQPHDAKAVPKGHWFEKARAVKCDTLFTRYGEGANDQEQEKFLFYDGIFPPGQWVKVDVTRDGVSLANPGKQHVYDVTVVDRRAEGKVRVGRIARLDGGATAAVEFAEADARKFADDASATLHKQLTAAGLFSDEASLLVDCWRHDLFVRPGMHVFYRIAEQEYQRAMPLTITPAPERLVRIGLIYHGNVEPELGDRVAELVKKLDADDFEVRQGAEDKLRAIGPAALPHLLKIRKAGGLSPETRKRVEGMVKDWSAKDAF